MDLWLLPPLPHPPPRRCAATLPPPHCCASSRRSGSSCMPRTKIPFTEERPVKQKRGRLARPHIPFALAPPPLSWPPFLSSLCRPPPAPPRRLLLLLCLPQGARAPQRHRLSRRSSTLVDTRPAPRPLPLPACLAHADCAAHPSGPPFRPGIPLPANAPLSRPLSPPADAA